MNSNDYAILIKINTRLADIYLISYLGTDQ